MVPLYTKAFGHTYSTEEIKRKFLDPYQKIQCSSALQTDDGSIASFYGVIYQHVRWKDQTFDIVQSCDSMTDPDHGGRGLFVRLAQEVYECLRSKKVGFVFGFPNKTIYGLRVKKLHWQHFEDINCFRKKILTAPLAVVAKKWPVFKTLYRRYCSHVLRKYKSNCGFFENSAITESRGGVIHDKDYFKYKGGADKYLLKLNGKCFWIKIDGYLWVGDFEVMSRSEFRQAFSTLSSLARVLGCERILFHFHEGSPNDLLLKSVMPVFHSVPYGFKVLNEQMKHIKLNFVAADFDTW